MTCVACGRTWTRSPSTGHCLRQKGSWWGPNTDGRPTGSCLEISILPEVTSTCNMQGCRIEPRPSNWRMTTYYNNGGTRPSQSVSPPLPLKTMWIPWLHNISAYVCSLPDGGTRSDTRSCKLKYRWLQLAPRWCTCIYNTTSATYTNATAQLVSHLLSFLDTRQLLCTLLWLLKFRTLVLAYSAVSD